MSSKTKGEIVVTVMAFLFISVLFILNYSEHSDKVFSMENFYNGTIEKRQDPRQAYIGLNNQSINSEHTCNLIPFQCADEKRLILGNGRFWITEKSNKDVFKEIPKDIIFTEEKAGISIKGLTPFKDGNLIIAPENCKFLNSNITSIKNGEIDIEIECGSNPTYILEFKDVKSWWCHNGKNDSTIHSDRVGKGGKIGGSLSSGYVIGSAKSSTKLLIRKIDSEGVIVYVNPEEYFIDNKVGKEN